jgi:four helix bundle protein
MPQKITSHNELEVYKRAFRLAMRLFELTKTWPSEEKYAATQQIRNSSRSVCANLAEGWRKRRYPASFTAKLTDADGEAAETQTWIEFAVACGYLDAALGKELHAEYGGISATLVGMITHVGSWTFPSKSTTSLND